MALVDVRGFDLNPRIGQGLARGIQTLGQFQLMGQRNLQIEREAGVREALGGATQMQPQTQQQQMLGEQTEGLGGALARAEQPKPVTTQEEKIELARQIDPAIANKQLKELGLDSASKRAEMSRFAAKLESLSPEQRFAEIEKRSQELDAQGRDSSHTRMLLDMDQDTQDKALLGVQLMDLTTKERLGVQAVQAKAQAKAAAGPTKPAEQLTFEALIRDFTPKEKKAARRVKAGIKSRSVGSALQTIAKEGTVQKIAKTKSMIEGAVVEAKIIAKEQGETFTSLKQAQAALPGLNSVVDKLRELAPIATSTLGGKLFNAAVKETGFGATEGATARAKFIAIVNNQVLPLLKPTFGAAFTVPEGDALRATMGDPDATPEEKMAQLDAFIAQKMRDIEAKEAQLKPQTEQVQATETVTPEATQTIIKFNRQGQRIR